MEYKGVIEPKLKHIYRAGIVALDRFKKIESFLYKGAKILDIGSGGGEFMYLLTKLGYETTGIEPNIGYAKYSRREYGLNIITGLVEDIDMSASEYDVVTMWHVLEHTDNPFLVLSHINRWLKNEGTLFIEVPNVEAICQAPINRFHFAHLYSFNLKTVEKIGIKAGFYPIVQEISADGGNLFIIFQKTKVDKVQDNWKIKGNAQNIIKILKKHTNIHHYISPYPYSRFLKKIKRIINERKAIRGFSRGKEILDYYYNKEILHFKLD
jgi:ubiquinone/menaquinone biosynthesis C-methylase UbiE